MAWRILRGRCAEISERHIAIVFQTVWLVRSNEHAVSGADPLRLASDRHQAAAVEDLVDLLWPVAVYSLLAARLNHC
jgi:hypothetical protein